MEINKDSILMIALKLTSICFISVLLLGFVNLITFKKIEENKIKKEKDAMNFLVPQAKNFSSKKYFKNIEDKLKETIYYYEAYDNISNITAYIVSLSSNGYGGKMKIMMAFDNNLKILNVKLLDNSETPGLGKKAEKDEYMNKFINTNTSERPFPKNKNMLTSNDSVTGATITFNGIVAGISKAIELLKNEI